MFRKSGTKRLSKGSDLFEEAAKNVSQTLVGKLVQSKCDPVRAALVGDEEEEPAIGLIVKVVSPNKWSGWQIHLLLEDKVNVMTYKSMTEFFNDWEIQQQRNNDR